MKRIIFMMITVLTLCGCQEQIKLERTLSKAEAVLWTEPDSALHLLSVLPPRPRYVTPATEAHYNLLLAQARSRAATTAGNDTLLEKAGRYYNCLPAFKPKEKRLRYELYLADYLLDEDSLESATLHLKRAEHLLDVTTPLKYRCLIYGSLGYLNRKNGQFNAALNYYGRAVNLSAENKDTVWMMNDLSSMLNIPGYDTTRTARLYPIEKQLPLVKVLPAAVQGKFWQNLGVWYNDQGKPRQAEMCLSRALAADTTRNSTRLTLARIYENRGQTASADTLYRHLLQYGNLSQQGTVWYRLYERHVKENRPDSAFICLHRYEVMLDSLYRIRDFARIQTIQARYDRQAVEIKLWKTKFYTIVIICVLILCFILIRYILIKDLKSQKRQVTTVRIKNSQLLEENENLSLVLIAREKSINQYKIIYQIPAQEMLLEKKDLQALNLFKQLQHPAGDYHAEKHYLYLTHWCNLLYNDYTNKLTLLYPALTPGETEICCLLRMGYTLNDLCRLFHNNENTLRKRIQRMYPVFNVTTRKDFLQKIFTIS